MYCRWIILTTLLFLNYTEAQPKNKPVIPKFVINFVRSKLDQILDKSGGNTQCAKDLKMLLNDLILLKKWAIEMVDATSKVSSGLLFGNIYMNGNFDQCLSIIQDVKNRTIRGQYCTVPLTRSDKYNDIFDFSNAAGFSDFVGIRINHQTADVLKDFKLLYGICLPDSCSISNLQKIWDYIEHTFRIPVHVNFVDMMCSTKLKSVEPYTFDKYVIFFFGIYFLVVLISTGYDLLIYQHITDSKEDILISFSIYTNAKKIFSVNNEAKYNTPFSAISGIKVFCMLWIIYAHRVLLNIYSGIINLVELHQWKTELHASFLLSGSYSVDSFFMLSGFLLSYGILTYQDSKLKKDVHIPTTAHYVYRFLRLSPGLIALILFNISIFKNLSDGPIWPVVATKTAAACMKKWFATIFFFNNFINLNYQCVEQAWYLAVDSQLFLISPILLTGLLKKPLKTCWACVGFCIMSGIYSFVITYRNNYGAIYLESNKTYQQNIYQSTPVRSPPWIIGIIFGFIMFKYKNIKLAQVTNYFAWIITFLSISGLILWHLLFTKNYEYSALNAAIFNGCARQLWAITIALLVFLCSINRHGLINKFLSLPIFQVLVKMSYSVFLTHVPVILYFIGSKRHSIYFKNINNIHDFLGDLLFVFLFATLWCLVFESPFIAIARYFYKNDSAQDTKVQHTKTKEIKHTKTIKLVCVYQYDQDAKNKKIE